MNASDKKVTFNPALPITCDYSIGSIQAALEYWLTHLVYRQSIEVESVTWKPSDHKFTVAIKRPNVVSS